MKSTKHEETRCNHYDAVPCSGFSAAQLLQHLTVWLFTPPQGHEQIAYLQEELNKQFPDVGIVIQFLGTAQLLSMIQA